MANLFPIGLRQQERRLQHERATWQCFAFGKMNMPTRVVGRHK